MNERFSIHNTHLESVKLFDKADPHLRKLSQQFYIFESGVLEKFPREISGVYTLTGGRQIGKTTLLKQFIKKLLHSGVDPMAICFFTGELIDDHHMLLQLLQDQLALMPRNNMVYLFVDEVTYIKNWEKTVKFMADAMQLENVILFLTGSDTVLLKKARMSFPGRRGKNATVDFHLYPLSFREFIGLKNKSFLKKCDFEVAPDEKTLSYLYSEMQEYLMHGGYLSAINDLALEKKILDSTIHTYSSWIRGDILKAGKNEVFLREIVGAIVKRLGSQITWNSLMQDLSIDHPKTISDYIELLISMDALVVQEALIEDKLVGAPKKARKVSFADPFIFHALRAWLANSSNIYGSHIKIAVNDSIISSQLVEAVVTSHIRRIYPAYYIKAKGEVDIAYIDKGKFWPIEVKWTNQLRAKDLGQIGKYQNGLILAKTNSFDSINGVRVMPLVWQLLWILE